MTTEFASELMFVRYREALVMTGLDEQYPIVDVTFDDGIITFILDDGKDEMVQPRISYNIPSTVLNDKNTVAGCIL